MSLILMSARFELLADGKRGRIIYSDGRMSAPFATQAMAAIILDRALFSGRMNVYEADLVVVDIEKSIKVMRSSELDRWCDETSDREEEELALVSRLTKSSGSFISQMLN